MDQNSPIVAAAINAAAVVVAKVGPNIPTEMQARLIAFYAQTILRDIERPYAEMRKELAATTQTVSKA